MSLPRIAKPAALSSLVLVAACASPQKALEEARAAEATHQHAEAARILEELLQRWPESQEVPAARAALAHVKFEQGIAAFLNDDTASAGEAFEQAAGLAAADSEEVAQVEEWQALATADTPRLRHSGSILKAYSNLPSSVQQELRTGLAAWACDGLDPRKVPVFDDCYTISTKPEIEYAAKPPKGKDSADLDQVAERYDRMERACTNAEAYIGRLCGEQAVAAFKRDTQARRDEFKTGLAANSQQWKADFADGWTKATKRLRKIAEAYEADKKLNFGVLSREFGVAPAVAGIIWHESSMNKSRAAGEMSDQVRALHLQYVMATGAIVDAETVWATGACSDSEEMKAFIRRLWDDAASAGLHPDKSWITETVVSDCPFIGETLR